MDMDLGSEEEIWTLPRAKGRIPQYSEFKACDLEGEYNSTAMGIYCLHIRSYWTFNKVCRSLAFIAFPLVADTWYAYCEMLLATAYAINWALSPKILSTLA
jgi:hypothetical protein